MINFIILFTSAWNKNMNKAMELAIWIYLEDVFLRGFSHQLHFSNT